MEHNLPNKEHSYKWVLSVSRPKSIGEMVLFMLKTLTCSWNWFKKRAYSFILSSIKISKLKEFDNFSLATVFHEKRGFAVLKKTVSYCQGSEA